MIGERITCVSVNCFVCTRLQSTIKDPESKRLRNNYQSRCYQHAEKLCRDQGVDELIMKACRRAAHRRAGKYFDLNDWDEWRLFGTMQHTNLC